MKILFEASFEKDLKKINDQKLFNKVLTFISVVKSLQNILEIINVKKLHGPRNFYRIRLGDYRLGFEYIDDTVIFVRILHRKDIYKVFP